MSSTRLASKTHGTTTKQLCGGNQPDGSSNNATAQGPATKKTDESQSAVKETESQSTGSSLTTIESDATQGRQDPLSTARNYAGLTPQALYNFHTADSVGPTYPTVPTMDAKFLNALSTDLKLARLAGITGGNNHCYRNSVLTAFLSSSVVSRYLMIWYCTRDNGDLADKTSDIMIAITQILAGLFYDLNADQVAINTRVKAFWQQFCYERTKKGAHVVKPSSWSWRQYRRDTYAVEETDPQDAHEFLIWLLAAMPRQFMHGIPDWQSNAPLERFEWVFKSQCASRIICGKCQYLVRRRNGTEAESCLVLRIPDAENTFPGLTVPQPLLSDLVKDSFATEVPMECSRCKKTSVCIQERTLQRAPALLMLTISRGRYDVDSSLMVKDCTAVAIPEQLDLSQHLNAHEFGEGSKVTYSLCSVVSHQGNQLDNGHYVSYVRGPKGSDNWYQINDQRVDQVTQAFFDDSAVTGMTEDQYLSRFTPYILFYEKNSKLNVHVAGREAMNVGEGGTADKEPTRWTGIKRDITPRVKDNEIDAEGQEEDQREDEEGALSWTMGIAGDEKSLPAVLLTKVSIGDLEVELPRHVISHLNWKKKRDIKIDVKLRAPKGQGINTQGNDHVEASLSDMQDEVYYNERQHKETTNGLVTAPVPAWNKFWKPVKRSADDLTEDEIQEVKKVCREQDNGGEEGDAS